MSEKPNGWRREESVTTAWRHPVALALVLLLSAVLAACGNAETPTPSSPPSQPSTAPVTGARSHAALKGYSGAFHVTVLDGSTFDLSYTYKPKAIATKPLDQLPNYGEIQLSADYSMKITNTMPGRMLGLKARNPQSPGVFVMYLWWRGPSPFCVPYLRSPSPEVWCAIKLAYAPLDQNLAPGASVDLAVHPGLAGPPADPGLIDKESLIPSFRDPLAQPDDFSISFQGDGTSPFKGPCSDSPVAADTFSGAVLGSQSGEACGRPMMLVSGPTEGIIGVDLGYTLLE